MTYAHNVILRLVIATALALTGLVAVSTATPAQAAVSQTYLNAYERQVVDAINAERVRRGLRSLRYTSCPDGYGERWALRLRTSNVLYHQSMTTVMRGCGATRAAENIARARTSAKNLVGLWMRSPGHRANILDRYVTQVGVGTQCASMCTTVADFVRR
jgi:Uncharacterized protein with SCP/PR1 domains